MSGRVHSFWLLEPASPRSCSHVASWRSRISDLVRHPKQFRPNQFGSLIKFRWWLLQEVGGGQLLGEASPGSRKELALRCSYIYLEKPPVDSHVGCTSISSGSKNQSTHCNTNNQATPIQSECPQTRTINPWSDLLLEKFMIPKIIT